MSVITLLSAGGHIGSGAAGVNIPWLRIALAFTFCIAVAAGAIALLRMRQGHWEGALHRRLASGFHESIKRDRRLSVIERVTLAPGHQTVLLRCDTRELLIHLGPQNACVIDVLPGEADAVP